MESRHTSGQIACPRCGTVMEEIENDFDELRLQHLCLCPSCYLVVWNDEEGVKSRQGTPLPPHRIVEA